MSIIELHNVSVGYGSRNVLDGVDLEVSAGEFVAVVGSNGAGKSTMLDVMAGDRHPASGRAQFLDRNLADWRARELARHRAYLTQSPRMEFDFRVEDVVGFGVFRDDPEVVATAMDRAGIADYHGRAITRLSGGERRRVHFARLLAQVLDQHQSELVLLDEPTAALDARHAHHLLATTLELTTAGSAVVVVLHDLNLAALFADRIVLLHDGGVHADGTPAHVLTPGLLHEVFGVETEILIHPHHGTPLVVPIRSPFPQRPQPPQRPDSPQTTQPRDLR